MAGAVSMAATGGTGMAITADSFAGGMGGDFNTVQSAILGLFKTGEVSEEGLDIRFITAQLIPQGHSAKQIRDAVGFLTDECHLYSTIDDDHFMTTA